MNLRKKLPTLQLRAEIAPETLNVEKRTVELVWSTGARVKRGGFWSAPFYEELSMDPKHVRLERLNSGAPLLDTHSRWSCADVIGVCEDNSARISGSEGRATVRFHDDGPDGPCEAVFQKVRAKIVRNVSVGYKVNKFEKQERNKDDELEVYRAVDWEPFEISMVPVGADAKAQARGEEQSEEKLFDCEITNVRQEDEETEVDVDLKNGKKRGEQVQDPQQPDVAAAEKKAREEGASAERKRSAEIKAAVRKAGLGDDFAEKLIGEGVELDKARELIIDKLAEKPENTTDTRAVNPRITAGDGDERTHMKRGVEEALEFRIDPAKAKLTDLGRAYQGRSLLELARMFVGEKGRIMNKSELARAALSTSDFPEVLANVASKSLRKSYELQPRTFLPFVSIGSLPDYKEGKRIQLGEVSNLEEVKEGAEFKAATLGESAEAVQLAKYGKIIRLTEETLINDDMDAFSRLPRLFGNACARLESSLVYTTVLVGNPAMSDSVALFHGSHGNLPSAAAISVASIGAARALMRKQKGVDNLDYLDLEPAFLVCGPDKETEALQYLAAIIPNDSAKVNPFQRTMTPIVDPRVTGNKWFVIASPGQVDTIEVLYLEGQTGPELVADRDFDTGGHKWRIKHVVAAKAIDHRGMVYNSGA